MIRLIRAVAIGLGVVLILAACGQSYLNEPGRKVTIAQLYQDPTECQGRIQLQGYAFLHEHRRKRSRHALGGGTSEDIYWYRAFAMADGRSDWVWIYTRERKLQEGGLYNFNGLCSVHDDGTIEIDEYHIS